MSSSSSAAEVVAEEVNSPAVASVEEIAESTDSAPQLTQEQMLALLQARKARTEVQGLTRKQLKEKQSIEADHKFWKTQPVPSFEDASLQETIEEGPIEPLRTVADVKPEGYNMPAGFEWCSVNILDDAQCQEVYTLLFENYVEDDDNMFRFDYSKEFLKWALTPPGYFPDWHVGVRSIANGKLLAFITGVPAHVRVHNSVRHMAEINFLCVHKKLRHKRLAPVLIKEITRRVNLESIWQAVYTAGVVIPTPVARCRYWHRSINPKKLVEIRFTSLNPRMTMSQMIKHYKLPMKTHVNFQVMEEEDVSEAYALVTKYLADRVKLAHQFTEAEFKHMTMTRNNVVNSFVLRDASTKKLTDFISFYHLPSTVIGNDKHNKLFAAYSYYNVATTMPFSALMKDALILARNVGIDVFNGLDVMDNLEAFEKNLFGIGDGHLQYYCYNWRCANIDAKDVGLVLL